MWNRFDQTGEIQIGWADSSNADTDGAQVQVLAENKYDADAFVSVIQG